MKGILKCAVLAAVCATGLLVGVVNAFPGAIEREPGLAFFMVLFFGAGVFYILDRFRVPLREIHCRIVGKEHCPSCVFFSPTTLTVDGMSGNNFIPGYWRLVVQLDGANYPATVDVDRAFYDSVQESAGLVAECVVGRFTGFLSVKSIATVA